jgi:hypothetical protein
MEKPIGVATRDIKAGETITIRIDGEVALSEAIIFTGNPFLGEKVYGCQYPLSVADPKCGVGLAYGHPLYCDAHAKASRYEEDKRVLYIKKEDLTTPADTVEGENSAKEQAMYVTETKTQQQMAQREGENL